MIQVGREATMEKLELLSHTALLKQGIDRTNNGPNERKNSSACEKAVLGENNNRLMSGSQSRNLLPPSAGIATAGTSSSRTGDRRNTASPSTLGSNATMVVGSNLASPVSTDIEDEVDGAVTSIPPMVPKARHNLHSAKARIIESRSPIATVEYGQFQAAPPSSPFPSSPQSYGFGLLPSHNHVLHQNHSQDQQDYPPSQYNNQNRNIIRTLSEASFTLYGNSLMHSNAQNVNVGLSNSSENEAAFRPPQREAQPPRIQLQQRRPTTPSRDDMVRQIAELRDQLSEKDMVVSSLQHRVNYLENQIHELRQLPTGKISHIPVE